MNLVFLGPPGAGKGTQANLLTRTYEVPQISTGEILRAAVKSKTPMGVKAKEYMDQGALVPDSVVVGIVEERLASPDCASGFILDGFPRTVAQADALKQVLGALGKQIEHVVSFEVDKGVLLERIVGRRVCRACGRAFHVKFDPPLVDGVCDACGGELYQRDDDREDTMRRRLEVYDEQTAPLKSYYEGERLLRKVNALEPIEDVQRQIVKLVESCNG
ncbi:adenylate kinase [Geobacter sulfurreducens]|uniref:Adenylate kinase n=1 Tax=Geobacter sulfurreducens (strain ATCC 51573 / DSM 12127 / PCA) TaxID=243231 RepID=KAD_GEOSL|nr:adenylate kinase [Geobacter sulfurreducens]Q749A8.1 RecName: Full=Adenylate kinase; Short=AK; AltName: Full=ATP-AMP transphosphorylase; AltName: Full=ATP:AMP phosphotransferase; AltName: Full=Adenylate monophosphate kinase [Geobacter sulfurreducens PCA]AAR36229.1 adenylate kinase [Geobacter sulfurreducens PCA]ADI85590.1 adenylate kinase [Geobacter sulfurreducens KN400]AJY69105.1 adenylate kinase [Geobacter sulfurreducens]QVW34652.1 adenylate kinase [Geobacter sulfurreducens]UAC03521.1 aden